MQETWAPAGPRGPETMSRGQRQEVDAKDVGAARGPQGPTRYLLCKRWGPAGAHCVFCWERKGPARKQCPDCLHISDARRMLGAEFLAYRLVREGKSWRCAPQHLRLNTLRSSVGQSPPSERRNSLVILKGSSSFFLFLLYSASAGVRGGNP